MTYIDGFVLAVPTANREKYEAAARKFDGMMIAHGALRAVEGWGDDVPHGKRTDFHRATEANADETVVFSWTEWPDKQVRDTAHAAINKAMAEAAEPMDMPFDGARMIYGGFATLFDLGDKA
ncbi:DUF1428 domain-containing protein [Novosphingobium sp. KCTC 2891]|uniref:DUF1428 domain-containing protein n=1 Tax=Novosphingobium sp. KCTC 2891 TaxID=2989730 RepID=UPI0022228F69|nr:DUF1428 domain-containing protein [Novosphingobium sp. KCTC 2891]MCW1382471.1 DUF1428 domain-containing protein [Novosphingobium sp. KCTC 2891]